MPHLPHMLDTRTISWERLNAVKTRVISPKPVIDPDTGQPSRAESQWLGLETIRVDGDINLCSWFVPVIVWPPPVIRTQRHVTGWQYQCHYVTYQDSGLSALLSALSVTLSTSSHFLDNREISSLDLSRDESWVGGQLDCDSACVTALTRFQQNILSESQW